MPCNGTKVKATSKCLPRGQTIHISLSDFFFWYSLSLFNLTVEEGMEPNKTTAKNLGPIQIYSYTPYSGKEPTAWYQTIRPSCCDLPIPTD